MNVTEMQMLERMQQMAANLASSLPQVNQSAETPKAEKGESFQDVMNKAQEQKAQAPKKDTAVKKTETVQDKDPAQKTEHKVVTDMRDPRIRALDPETQAQIAAGFLTPLETESGTLLLRVDAKATAIITPLLPNGMRDTSKPIVLVNSEGEQFEFYLDQENGGHKLFQVMDGGMKKPVDLFPEQPKSGLLDDPKTPDMPVITTDGKVQTLGEAPQQVQVKTVARPDANAEPKAGGEEETDTGRTDGEVPAPSQPLFKDVKAAPVKVGENFTLDTQEPDMEEQLADTIRTAAMQNLRQVEIKLSPENLGSLTVKLTQASDGTLQVVLHASSPKAANLLTQHLDGLNAALQGYGHSEVRLEVQRSGDSQQAQQQQQQTDPNGHNRQQQQQQQHHHDNGRSEDFIQRLRLGLFSLEDVV